MQRQPAAEPVVRAEAVVPGQRGEVVQLRRGGAGGVRGVLDLLAEELSEAMLMAGRPRVRPAPARSPVPSPA
ncbi:hypothetical protein [Micromonospora fulviviridis]|uniref:Uncharacterized protein n=1 Tax=Micromonospora fulviviridis TaxID=47860 RepID=A0ABV2VPP7_9ACTN